MLSDVHVLHHRLEKWEACGLVKVGIAHAGDIHVHGLCRLHLSDIVGVMREHRSVVQGTRDHLDQLLIPRLSKAHVTVELQVEVLPLIQCAGNIACMARALHREVHPYGQRSGIDAWNPP